MSEPRKDVRVWFDGPYHRALKRIAQAKKMDMDDWLEQLATAEIDRLVHEASVIAESASELGIGRIEPDSAGLGRNAPGEPGRGRR